MNLIDHDIPQMEPLFGEEERALVDEYLRHPGFITEFKRTAEFEAALATFTGAKHCIVVNNGTVSLSAIAIALGIRAGDAVIVPNFTMIATANAFAALGIKPQFVDVERETLCINLDKLMSAVTPQTKAVVLVNANGRSPTYDVSQLREFCDKRGLFLIEDSAQGLGSYYPDGRHVGLAGVAGSLSFSAPKIISTGQGGAILTNDDEMAVRLRRVKDFGRDRGGQDYHPYFGLNFKFTELQACVGIAQMRKLAARIERKRAISQRYERNLRDVRQVELFRHDFARTTPWFVDAIVEEREQLIEFLNQRRVKTRKMYPPINKQPIYNEPGTHPVSELVGQHGLWLPSHSHLTDVEIDYVCACISSFFQ